MGEKNFILEIVTPRGLVVSSKVEEVYLPGADGDLDILPDHASLLTSLRIGELHYRWEKEVTYVAINRGFAEITPTKTIILTDTAERAENIDVDRAQSAKARAEEQLRGLAKEHPSYHFTLEALRRATGRLRVAEKAHRG